MRKATVGAVGDGPVVVEGREDAPDRRQDVVCAPDIQKRFLLARKGRIRKVFGRGGGTDGK